MHRAQEQVRDFHRAMGLPAPGKGRRSLTPKEIKLRLDLIEEEAKELRTAFDVAGSLVDGSTPITVDQIDALIDLLYVTYGAAVQMGLDLRPFFELVHEANMKKGPGPMREDGKKLKPLGWEPPDHHGELRRQQETE